MISATANKLSGTNPDGRSSASRQHGSLHPLSGCNPATLLAVLARNGGVAPRHWRRLAGILGAVLLRQPISFLERLHVARHRDSTRNAPPPLFIVGHWRSGTTHLYNLLGRSPELGYVPPYATGLPWDFLLMSRWCGSLLERSLPKERFIDRIPVTPESPQEDEIGLASMQTVSFYHALYFPGHFWRNFRRGLFLETCSPREIRLWEKRFRYFLNKLQLQFGKKSLVIKNPVHSGHLARLNRLCPGARFIHIVRHPAQVYRSMRNFYARLFEQFALQEHAHLPIEDLVMVGYAEMMQRLIRESGELPAENWMEIRYEEFEKHPLDHLRQIYSRWELGDFARDRRHFETYLESVKTYQKNDYKSEDSWPPGVREAWKPFLDHWGYTETTT